jgi:hypothetical protein
MEVAVPSRVGVEQGPHGVRFAAADGGGDRLTTAQVRELMEQGRR